MKKAKLNTLVILKPRFGEHTAISQHLLTAEGMSWHDVVRTTNYLRDIERDYDEFNKIRTSFYNWMKIDPLPASTGIQARLCWETLLYEIEVYAISKMN